ncbi:receptor-type tyrosine-protein phosphatase mu-like isoform X2 [Littorina saxatilis]|uniref:receptor-type tyrosine-protein phosphatase mu-like isoform X2 n=1 Tax=Littorina saxatilis TaxID=31220 RepID=UPI0038B5B674
MKGCAIYVDEKECYRFDTVPDRKTNVTCGSGVLRGRIVKVSKNTTGISGGDITINICEVQVLSCRNDSWGSGCDMRCGNCSKGEVCDKVTGHCSSCPLGLQPPLCDTGCRNDSWGSGCDMRCGNCSNGEVCDKVTGHCSSCPLGLQPPLCDADCAHRTFGHNCTQTCSEGCEDVCDKVSGHCTCKPGWLGPACGAENVALNKACNMSSQYGNTNNRHPPEAAANGNTNGSYLRTTNCIHTALYDSAPWWQVDLGRMYSVHRIVVWARTAEIQRMKGCAIYVGEEECYRFDTVPDRKTNVTCGSGVLRGRIVKVSKNTTGISGGDITINICEVQVLSCRNDSWGSGCDMRCGNCSNGEVCDKVTGHCSSCPLGLQPPLCDTGCRNNSWGSGCDMRCGNCSNGEVCDKVTGHCSSCPLGLQPPLCDTDCAHRTFGHNCTQTCSAGCEDVCDKVSGNCTCKPGWLGPACDAETPIDKLEAEFTIIGGAVGGSVVVLVVIIIIVVIVVRRRRIRPKAKRKKENSSQEEIVDQTTQQVNVYQNLPDATNGNKRVLARQNDQQADTKPEVAPRPEPRKKKSTIKKKSAANSEGVAYVNVAFEESSINPAEPPYRHDTQATGVIDAVASDDTTERIEEEDVVVELEDNEVDLEVEKQYDAEVRERVYYNDGVYMTSAGSDLKLDTVQESLLEKLRGETIDQEFESLPMGLTKPHDTGAKDENYYKNRFKSILPYDDTRVVLHGDPDPGSSDYINASCVAGLHSSKAYIAAQGPNRNTVRDFWKMVWQEQVTRIVMLTNVKEGKKKKCEQYWPPPGKKVKYGSIDVTGLESHERAHYVMRTFDMMAEDGSIRRVAQYHYTMWPDHGIPTTTGLVDFWRTVRTSHRQQQQSSPLLVHCSAGVGRTGTFIGLDILMDQLQQQQHIDICQVVNDMRNGRCNMVQAKSQYCILHEAVLEAYTSQDTRLSGPTFDSVFKHHVDPHHSNSRIDTECKKLKQMKVLMQKPRQTAAEKEENINKNRYLDILPDDRYLVHLTIPAEKRSDYINAVMMPTFTEQQGSILTQLPLRDTMVDLWRLVAGSHVSLIVSLGSEIVQPEEKSCYWPREENDPLAFGPFIVRLKSRSTLRKHITRYTLSLQYQGQASPRSVELLHYSDWKGDLPGSVEDLVHLVVTVLSTQSQQGHSPILFQCSDGATKSGLLHAICDVIRRMTSEGNIDAYMSVRHIQIVRPQCLMSKVQYRFIYRAVQEYKKRNDVYANASLL